MYSKMMFVLLLVVMCLPVVAQDTLDDLLVDYVAEDDPSVVLYIRYEDYEATAVQGLADLENGTPAQVDDLYRIGSITKPFVATIILQLVEQDMLSLDDPIADYLPDEVVSRVENADTATVRQMLQMTSGIFSYTESDAFDDATLDDPTHAWTAAEVVAYAYDEPAYFSPGEDYYYSNTNYILAQMIIESLTDATLADELQARIFEPLGMDSCYLETPDVFAKNIVRGYSLYDDYEDMTEVNDGVGLGDGGIVCTAADLAKFPPGLINDLLEADTFAAMTDTVDDGEGGQYGLGIGYDNDSEFGMILGHDGATSGFQSTMQYLPDEDLVVVILTNNFDSDIVTDLAYDAMWFAMEE